MKTKKAKKIAEPKKMTWDEAMDIWQALPREEHFLLRRAASRRISEGGAGEVGTSDVNWEVFYIVSEDDHKRVIKEQREYEKYRS